MTDQHSFAYIATDIAPGTTIPEYRIERHRGRRGFWLASLLKRRPA
jgi:hypothetical protein